MKKLVLILSTLLICSQSFAGVNNITEEDGSPSVYPWRVKFTNGTVTDNGDGTASVSITGGAGGGGNVNTSDIAEVPYYISRTNISGDVNNLWDATNNTHIISADAGQLGSVLAFSITNKNGFSVANISHDGSGAFKKLNLSEDLAVRDGGTGASSFTANGVMLGNGFSALSVTTADTATNHFLGSTATTPAFRQIMAQDLSFAGNANALTYYPTATTLGTLTADTTAGHVLVSTATLPNFRQLLTSDVSGTLPLAKGGTGITSGTAKALVYFPNTGVMGSLTADTTAGHTLFSTSTLPSFRQALTSDSIGTMPVARGGTGMTSGTSGAIPYFNTAGSMASTLAFAANAMVVGGGSGTAPFTASMITTDTSGLRLSVGPGTDGRVSMDVGGSFRTVPVTTADGATIQFDASKSNVGIVRLAGQPRTMLGPVNGTIGQKFTAIISQDSTGSRKIGFGAGLKFGTTITSFDASTVGGSKDYVGMIFSGITWDVVAVLYGYR